MFESNISIKTYILPFIAMILFLIFTNEAIDLYFSSYIQNPIYRKIIYAIILLTLLFIVSVVIDNYLYLNCFD